MSQPPNHPENDPQWNPQTGSAEPSQAPAGQFAPDGQPHGRPVGPDGQPWNGPVGPDGQPWTGPIGPDGQPYTGPIGPDGQPQPGYSAAAPVQPKNPFGIKKLLSALLVLILLGVGAYFIWNNQQKSAALTVGNCIVPSGDQKDLDVKVVDCADDSVYSEYVGEVLTGSGTCTDEGAVQYTFGSEKATPDKADKVGCVIPQLFEGKCYNVVEDTLDIEMVGCDAAQLRVTKVVQESEASCDDADAQPISYTVPARTYCVVFTE